MADAMTDKSRLRTLRFLSRGPARLTETAKTGKWLLDAGERGAVPVEKTLLARMVSNGLVLLDRGEASLSPQGRRLAEGGGAQEKQTSVGRTKDIETRTVTIDGAAEIVVVNAAESPLAQLVRLKTREGKSFLSKAEFDAGERFRSDYTRGQLMPRMSANWIASVSSGRRGGGVAELTESAMAARMRVEKAIDAVGPELSGVMIDVCCFLKGLTTVEAERGWPVRSAKVMLKTALGALARHYNPAAPGASRRTFHWGSKDYRPSLEQVSG